MQTVVMDLFSLQCLVRKCAAQLKNCSGNNDYPRSLQTELQVFNLKAHGLFGMLIFPSEQKYH